MDIRACFHCVNYINFTNVIVDEFEANKLQNFASASAAAGQNQNEVVEE